MLSCGWISLAEEWVAKPEEWDEVVGQVLRWEGGGHDECLQREKWEGRKRKKERKQSRAWEGKNSFWKQRTQDRILSLHLNNSISVKKPLPSPEDCFSLMSCWLNCLVLQRNKRLHVRLILLSLRCTKGFKGRTPCNYTLWHFLNAGI